MTLETGIIPISETEQISPDLTEEAFLATPTGALSREFVRNEPHHSYVLPKIVFKNREWIAVLYFTDGRLSKVSMTRVKNRTWLTFDPEYEQKWTVALKTEIELQLQRNLPANFPWGEIAVEYDPRGVSGALFLTYSKDQGA